MDSMAPSLLRPLASNPCNMHGVVPDSRKMLMSSAMHSLNGAIPAVLMSLGVGESLRVTRSPFLM